MDSTAKSNLAVHIFLLALVKQQVGGLFTSVAQERQNTALFHQRIEVVTELLNYGHVLSIPSTGYFGLSRFFHRRDGDAVTIYDAVKDIKRVITDEEKSFAPFKLYSLLSVELGAMNTYEPEPEPPMLEPMTFAPRSSFEEDIFSSESTWLW
jgi:hypothetical protein